jgi:integrase
MRILSRVEEARLLALCTGPKAYLHDAIVCGLDTALRQNEQLTLATSDVYLDSGLIRVRARNAKIQEERVVPITARLAPVLARLLEDSTNGQLFADGTIWRIKRNFVATCRLAGIDNFRWHDLRHTATMRMLDAIKDPAKVMKITGHKQWSTFMIYVNIDEEIAREVAGAMDAARGIATETPVEVHEERVN